MAPWGQGPWGLPMGPSGQGLAARAHTTTPLRSRAAGGHWSSPRHQAPSWGREQAKAGQGRGPAGRPKSADPMAGQGRAGLWGTGDQPCCAVTGAGAGSTRGLTWGAGPWAGWGEPQGWAETGRAGRPSGTRHIKCHMPIFKETLDTILQTTVLRKPGKTS